MTLAPSLDSHGQVAEVLASVDDVLDYWIDWSGVLADSETIASSSWSVSTGMTKGSEGRDGSKCYVFAGPATGSGAFDLVNTVTTSQGRTYERTLRVIALRRLS